MGGRDALISAVTTGEVIEATRARRERLARSTMCSPRRIKRGNHSRCKREWWSEREGESAMESCGRIT